MKRDSVFGEGVTDQDMQDQYGISSDPMKQEGDVTVDGGMQTSKYSGQQPKPSTTVSRPGAAENGGGGY